MKKIHKKLLAEQPLLVKSRKLAKQLYDANILENKRAEHCGDLLIKWVKECYWGLKVADHLPVFDKVWKILHERKHTKKNKFIYGDIDVGLWIEYPKAKHKRVIVSESYCTCAEDNTHIFIEEHNYEKIPLFEKLRVVTVWPRQDSRGGYRTKDGWHHWGDDRDIKIPSLNTYRERDFKFGYSEGRDKGHCILYHNCNKMAEDAYGTEHRIEHALHILSYHLEALENDR